MILVTLAAPGPVENVQVEGLEARSDCKPPSSGWARRVKSCCRIATPARFRAGSNPFCSPAAKVAPNNHRRGDIPSDPTRGPELGVKQTDIAKATGYSPSQVSRILCSPDFQQVYNSLISEAALESRSQLSTRVTRREEPNFS